MFINRQTDPPANIHARLDLECSIRGRLEKSMTKAANQVPPGPYQLGHASFAVNCPTS